jgi:hypothetical protein
VTRRPPQLHVHVEHVVLHELPAIGRDALADAIQTALATTLASAAEARRAPLTPAAQVGRAVAPAVLGAIGMEGAPR